MVTAASPIAAIDAQARTVSIKRENSKLMELEFGNDCKVFRDGKLIDLDKRQVGQETRAVWFLDKEHAFWIGIYVKVDRTPIKRSEETRAWETIAWRGGSDAGQREWKASAILLTAVPLPS
jgi:hypothetical protein